MTSLLVSIGGASYPQAPSLQHASFMPSSEAIAKRLMIGADSQLPPGNHLNLFNDNRSWPEQLIVIRNWVRSLVKSSTGTGSGSLIENVLIHYVGHGMFKTNSEEHYLSINSTDAEDRWVTSASLRGLNDILLKSAAGQRRIYFIDACFAAASVRNLMSPSEDAIEINLGGILGAWPEGERGSKGVAALCSADRSATADAGGERGLTQFSDGLLHVLEVGNEGSGEELTLRQVHRLLTATLVARYGEGAVHPVLVAPEDRDGGIAAVPIFPNPSSAGRLAHPLAHHTTGSPQASYPEAAPKLSQGLVAASCTDEGLASGAECGRVNGKTSVDGEGALNPEQIFRQATYRFFRLPHSEKDEIATSLNLVGAAGAVMPDLERYKAALRDARARGLVNELVAMIGRAEQR